MMQNTTYRRLAFLGFMLWCSAIPAVAGQIQWRSEIQDTPIKTPTEMMDAIAVLAERPDARHIVVQFDQPVGPNEQAELEAAGLTLLTYLGDNAFFSSLSADADAGALASTSSLTHAGAIQRTWKLHPVFARGEIPEWAIVDGEVEENPTVAAYVLLHPDVPLLTDGVEVCEQYGAVVRSELHTVNGLVIELPWANVPALADEDAVQWIEPPLPRMSEVNDSNRQRVQADIVQEPPYSLEGSGVTVLVYDAGTARATHQDFGGRLMVRDASGMADHATHVAGTVGGDGAANGGLYRGMAPGITIESYGFEPFNGFDAGFLYTDPGDIEADYNEAINVYGVDIANNSIGSNVAKNGFPCDWEGDYGVTSMVIDSIVRGTLGSPFRVVWSNGNERGYATCGTDYYTTAPPSGAKNHISVGAVNSNDDSMTDFSSWGPTDDGRLKPDICAPGCQSDGDGGVTSCSSSGDASYVAMCGTSMAAPTVTGISTLLLEDFRTHFPFHSDPRNSTLKILLAHNAVDLSPPGPDYQTGYGSIRIQDTIDFMRLGSFVEATLDYGDSYTTQVEVLPGETELKVTLAWDDWPGTPNVTPSLVNDLDLRVLDPSGVQHFPWTLDSGNPAAPAVQTQADHINNIEQVVVQAPAPGAWQVEVVAFSMPMFPQAFSLCAAPSLPINPTLELDEAISRPFTVFNVHDNTPVLDEAVSRAHTAFSVRDSTPVLDEAVSRSHTAFNVHDSTPVLDEAISRAHTVCNGAGLGDVNEDGVADGRDIGVFIDVVLGFDSEPAHIEASDMNCDGVVDMEDIMAFVQTLIAND